ncbi:MAG: hypothetical protein M3O32_08660 [Actinomycetota bacterium]|nr:hypothetical protein [Actinomycetota bacterium]
MRPRAKAVLAAAAVIVIAGPVQAAGRPNPACPTIIDAPSDQGPVLDGGLPDSEPGATALDLQSVNVGATHDDLVVTLSVTDINDREPVYVGHRYSFGFGTETTRYALVADLSSDGNDFALFSGPLDATGSATRMTGVAEIHGAVEAASNTVRMTVPLALLRKIGATGRVTGLEATAGREIQNLQVNTQLMKVGHGGYTSVEDTLSTPHPYAMGSRGCP